MKLKNRIRVRIHALNQESFFNKVVSQKVKIYNLKRFDKEAEFDILPKDISLVKATLENNNIDILELKEEGVSVFKKELIARFCIPLALFFALVGFFVSNFFVCQISITGCNKIKQESITQILSQNGISPFKSKATFDCDKIELLILENFQQVSLVSASCIGCSLVINIKEKAEDLSLISQSDIISNFEGRVISIEVNNGEAVVENGDIVKVGDVLVKGIKDSDTGIIQPAKATIKAEAWVQNVEIIPCEKVEFEKTGRVQNFRTVEVFDKIIYSNKSEPKFDNYLETIKVEHKFNSILPIIVTYFLYEEVEEKIVAIDFETKKDEYIEQSRQNALQTLQSSDIILDEKYFITNEMSFTQINYVITIEKILVWS